MSQIQDYVFILWGERFEEAAATIFITELRRVGLRVKMVGLTQRRISGAHGLVLVPDLTLEEALPLANRTICLVIPCQSPGLKRLQSDPRLQDFFEQIDVNKAIIVTGQAVLNLGLLPDLVEKVIFLPENEDLIVFAREVADHINS